MIGMGGAVGLVKTMLQTQMPTKIAELRTELSRTPAQLPNIKRFRPVAVTKSTLADYPVLYVAADETASVRPQQKTPYGKQYGVLYRMTVVTLVRSTSDELTQQMQLDVARAVRECLLQHLQLAPQASTQSAGIQVDSLAERFSGIETYGSDRATYGGCMTAVSVLGQEYLHNAAPDRTPSGQKMVTTELLRIRP